MYSNVEPCLDFVSIHYDFSETVVNSHPWAHGVEYCDYRTISLVLVATE